MTADHAQEGDPPSPLIASRASPRPVLSPKSSYHSSLSASNTSVLLPIASGPASGPPPPPAGFQPPVAFNPAAQHANSRSGMFRPGREGSGRSSGTDESRREGSAESSSSRQDSLSNYSSARSSSSTGSSPGSDARSSSSAHHFSPIMHNSSPLFNQLNMSRISSSPSPPPLSVNHAPAPPPPLRAYASTSSVPSPFDLHNPPLFSPSMLAPSAPHPIQRSTSDAWDSVWPATSPFSVPHLPSVSAVASNRRPECSSPSGSSNPSSSGSAALPMLRLPSGSSHKRTISLNGTNSSPTFVTLPNPPLSTTEHHQQLLHHHHQQLETLKAHSPLSFEQAGELVNGGSSRSGSPPEEDDTRRAPSFSAESRDKGKKRASMDGPRARDASVSPRLRSKTLSDVREAVRHASTPPKLQADNTGARASRAPSKDHHSPPSYQPPLRRTNSNLSQSSSPRQPPRSPSPSATFNRAEGSSSPTHSPAPALFRSRSTSSATRFNPDTSSNPVPSSTPYRPLDAFANPPVLRSPRPISVGLPSFFAAYHGDGADNVQADSTQAGDNLEPVVGERMEASDVVGYVSLEMAAQQLEGVPEPDVQDPNEVKPDSSNLENAERNNAMPAQKSDRYPLSGSEPNGRDPHPRLTINTSNVSTPSSSSSSSSSSSLSPNSLSLLDSSPHALPLSSVDHPLSLSPANVPLPSTPSIEPHDQYFAQPSTPYPEYATSSSPSPPSGSPPIGGYSEPVSFSNPRDAMQRRKSMRERGPSRLSSSFSPDPEQDHQKEEPKRKDGKTWKQQAGDPQGSMSSSSSEDEDEHEDVSGADEREEENVESHHERGQGPTVLVSAMSDEPQETSPTHPCHDPDHGVEFCDSPEEDELEAVNDDENASTSFAPYLGGSSPSTERPSSSAAQSARARYPFRTFNDTPGPGADEPSFFPPVPSSSAAGAGYDSNGLSILDDGGEGLPMDGQEGRFLPVAADMDLEDESLTTLERIFLLSKSEFTHHRTFISRVIGDWVEDVDPCETVEYVLPLLNSLGTDEDEAVREALAPGLHKILWFFYSSCRLMTETDEPLDDPSETADAPPTTAIITSEGLDVVKRPTKDELKDLCMIADAQAGVTMAEESGPSSSGSGVSGSSGETRQSEVATESSDTPNSTLDSGETKVSETAALHPFGPDYDNGGKEPVKMPRPVISVQTFTPLIGSLLMSQSPVVCESAKVAIIGILARLRGKELPAYDPWPQRHVAVGEQKTYLAQTGIHVHEITTLTEHEKKVVENELVQAIVIGMARLDETQSPYCPDDQGDDQYGDDDGYYDEADWEQQQYPVEGQGGDGEQSLVEMYGEHEGGEGSQTSTWAAGDVEESVGKYGEEDDDQSNNTVSGQQPSGLTIRGLDETIPYDASHINPLDPDLNACLGESSSNPTDEATFRTKPHPTIDLSQDDHPHASHGDAVASGGDAEVEGSNSYPLHSPSYIDASIAEHTQFNSDEFDSPNAPPVDNRTDPDEAEWAASGQDDGLELGDDTFKDELAFEASHGRLLSMNLISAVTECKVLEGDDVIAKQFVPEVVRMRYDESFGVRREAALAMGELLKVVPQEIVAEELVSLYDAFASDDSPHVRQAACLGLPALAKRLEPQSFRRSHTLQMINAFFEDQVTEIHGTALEVLGELIHVFHDDEEGPPERLIALFLGKAATREAPKPKHVGPTLEFFASGAAVVSEQDDARPLVCAFNYPAVTLTVGRKGWPSIRDYYLQLCGSREVRVRRSLAASLHEMAVILGDEISTVDLVPFFRLCLKDVEEVRERLWDNLHVFIETLEQATTWPLVHEIGDLLIQGQLGSWRLRERLMLALPVMADTLIQANRGRYLVISLLREGLIDQVAAVRAAAIKAVCPVYGSTRRVDDPEAREALDEILIAMSRSPSYRQRRTFVQCAESFLDANYDAKLILARWPSNLIVCNEDPVVEVRIALARFISRVCAPDGICPVLSQGPPDLIVMAESLRRDEAFDIQTIIAGAFPDEPLPRRVSSVASTPNGSHRHFHRPSNASSGSFASRSSFSGSPAQQPLQELEEPESHETALQLKNIPSPVSFEMHKIIPGYELGGYGFPSEVHPDVAKETVSFLASGGSDPLLTFRHDVSPTDETHTSMPASETTPESTTPRPMVSSSTDDSYFTSAHASSPSSLPSVPS